MTRTVRLLDCLIEGGVIAVLALSPLPFGSVLPWTQAVIESAVALLCVLSVVRMLVEREVVIRVTPLLWPGLAMAALLGFQLMRPGGSASPYATEASVRLYLAYFGLLVVLSNHLMTRQRIERLVWALVACGVAYATLGLVTEGLGVNRILWFPKQHYVGRLTSTLVNPNHQALYLAVPLFLALGLLLRPRRGRRGPERPGGDPFGSTALATKILLAGGSVAMGAALLLTQSRGGVVSALIGVMVILALSLHGGSSGRTSVVLGLAVSLFMVYASTFGLDVVVQRLSIALKEPASGLRWPTWEATLAMVTDAPLLGIGLGAFRDAFPAYQPLTIWSGYLVDYAHNDYLQLLVETGLVGVIVLVWAVVGLLVYVLGRWVGRKDPFVRGLVMGGLGALTAVLAHSATDFGLHMPANALLVVALGALLPAVVSLRLHRAGYRVDLPEWRLPLSSLTSRAVTTAILVAGIVVAGMPVPRAMAARYRASDVDQPWSAAQSVLARAYDDLRVATRLDPRNPEYQGTLAAVTTELAGRAWGYGVTPEGRRVPISTPLDRLRASQELWGTACAAYEDALRSRPRDPGLLERFGSFLGRLERVRRSVNGQPLAGPLSDCLARVLGTDTSILPLAVEQFRRAVRWEPNNAERHRSLALFVLAHRNDVANAPETIASALRGALSLERSMLGDIADRLLAPPSADLDLLWASMPRQVPVMLDLAWQLERRGRAAAATAALEKALAIAIDPELQKDVRVAHGRLLLTRDDVTGAIAQLRHALVLAPGNPDVFAALGEAYESGRRWSEAESAFTSAVSLAEDASPQQANVHRNRLAGYLTRRGDLDRALVLRELVARDTPADPWAHVEIGKLLEQRGEWGLAFRKYQEAERLGAKSSDVSAWVARTYARRGLLREAVVAYENAVHLAPRLADVRAELGELYSRTGRPEQAVQQFRQILATHPNHEAARRGLTSVIVQSTASSKE